MFKRPADFHHDDNDGGDYLDATGFADHDHDG
jgi:hypothetical protein